MSFSRRSVIAIIIVTAIACLAIGATIGAHITLNRLVELEDKLKEIEKIRSELSNIKSEIADASRALSKIQNQVRYLNSSIISIEERIHRINVTGSLESIYSVIYERVRDSIVLVKCIAREETVFGYEYVEKQGSGFIYNCNGMFVVLTNNHVVRDAINIIVTFSNGESYPAKLLGGDPYADLAVLSVNAPLNLLKPLEIVSSSMLKIGDEVIVVGNPFGLTSSIRHGIVSQLGRAIPGEMTGGFPLADVIQISVPINPGDSGAPLLNLKGQVVGIATAIVRGAQGVGFAISSDTILREVPYLIEHGYYDLHPWLGIACTDMTYEIAKVMKVNVTYGVLVVEVVEGSPADKAGLRGGNRTVEITGRTYVIGGDIIIAINGTKVISVDSLVTYLEKYTLPGQTVELTIMRNGKIIKINVTLEKRPLR